MNSGWIYNNAGKFHRNNFGKKSRIKFEDQINYTYLVILSRPASDKEIKIIKKYDRGMNRRGVLWNDLVWALVNSKEFIFHH